jgi:hypothetical protein
MTVGLMMLGSFTLCAVALYANYKMTVSALHSQQLANKRLTDLTRHLALLAKSPDVVIGQGAIEVDRQNSQILEEQERLRLEPEKPLPSEPPSPPKPPIATVGGDAFQIVGGTPEEERAFFESLDKGN